MSVIVGGSAVLGGAIAGALCDDNADFLIDKIIEERKKVESLERENYFIRVDFTEDKVFKQAHLANEPGCVKKAKNYLLKPFNIETQYNGRFLQVLRNTLPKI